MLLDKLDYVIAVAEEQNLTRAAQRLFISQPTLTLYLNRLEQELGVKLFDRGKSPIQMTNEGSYYLEQMKKVRAMAKSIQRDLLEIADPSRALRIGIGQVRGNHWLPIALPSFCSLYPGINIHIVQSIEEPMAELLQTDRLDLAFGALPPSLYHLKTVEMLQAPEPLLLVAHKQFGLIPPERRDQFDAHHPYVISPQRLDGLPFIAPSVSNGLYDTHESILSGNNIRPSRVITVTNLVTGMHLTARALGVQLVYLAIPQYVFLSDTSHLDFCVLERMPTNRRPCIAAYRDSNIKTPMIRDFIDIIQREVIPTVQSLTVPEVQR